MSRAGNMIERGMETEAGECSERWSRKKFVGG